jgi:hypothetical protein
MKRKDIEILAEAIAKHITKKEDTVFPYIGNGSYVLDQDGLREVLIQALIAEL